MSNNRIRGLVASTLGRLPVTVRSGCARGARWTLFPWSSYWKGTHEPKVQRVIENLGDLRGWSCWDLGAHFGLYSVALAMRVGPTGQVAAFEPNPRSYSRLLLHKRMNGLDWLVTYCAAVSENTGSSALLTYGDLDSTSTHLAYEDESLTPASRPMAIQTLRLDDEVEAKRLRPPDFVKIDVEGHGHRALRGMRASIESNRPIIIAAFHSREEVDGMSKILEPLGYSREPIVEPPPGGAPLVGGDYLFRPSARS